MRVLVIEDDEELAATVAAGLRHGGMAVDVAYDGANGHEMALVTRYDVVVLDRDLPGVHGDRICADLVASGALTRVLMLTASGTVADRVEGLKLGADDYLPKPFAFEELVARVRALGRRATPVAPPVLVAAGVRHGGMAVDLAFDGRAGLTRALVNEHDVIVLDRDLPEVHGDEVCAKLVAAGGRTRVLMLTGAAGNEDLIDGLGLGADDYLPKVA